MSSSKTLVQFKGVRKKYFKLGQRTLKEMLHSLFIRGEKPGQYIWALDDVSFTLKEGTTLGIIGPNGSGKSTLLKLMAKVTEPTEGKVTVNAQIAPLIELGAGFHPELTGIENIYLNGAILGMDKPEVRKKLPAIIEFAELGDYINSPVKFYSSGMYLRLAFSVAIHVDSDILLIDEILAVGDHKFQQKCMTKLNALKKSGKTIILVSHNIHTVFEFCETGIFLKEGKIVAHSNIKEVVNKYNRYMRQQ